MQSFYYEAVTYDGVAYCLDHSPELLSDEGVMPIFADSEWDSYPYCDKCGKIFDYVNLLSLNQ